MLLETSKFKINRKAMISVSVLVIIIISTVVLLYGIYFVYKIMHLPQMIIPAECKNMNAYCANNANDRLCVCPGLTMKVKPGKEYQFKLRVNNLLSSKKCFKVEVNEVSSPPNPTRGAFIFGTPEDVSSIDEGKSKDFLIILKPKKKPSQITSGIYRYYINVSQAPTPHAGCSSALIFNKYDSLMMSINWRK
ncbi:MAG: hypothetical protein GWP09_01305 [Nitrospiraceae bacterium]|nr:hypothetical protein [Nitrospiraceae bacterium]